MAFMRIMKKSADTPAPDMHEAAVAPFKAREFPYTRQDFEQAREFIYRRAGISLTDAKAEMVYSRLAKRLRVLAIGDFKSYLAQLNANDHPEWEHFINALTTNLTDFFREAHHFSLLVEHAHQSTYRPFRVWSAACATGEEPYSIAIALCEAFDTMPPPIRIVASDLDTDVLNKAKQGVYVAERVSGVAMKRLKRFFLKGKSAKEGSVMVRPEVRALVQFHQLNLRTDTWNIDGPFDAIFCRNVLIYFDKPTQYQVLQRLADRLTPNGLLFAGHSESLIHAADIFQPCGRTVYRLAHHIRTRHG